MRLHCLRCSVKKEIGKPVDDFSSKIFMQKLGVATSLPIMSRITYLGIPYKT